MSPSHWDGRTGIVLYTSRRILTLVNLGGKRATMRATVANVSQVQGELSLSM